ncbi:MAG: hypothetical protein ABIE70_05405 [bacterium]
MSIAPVVWGTCGVGLLLAAFAANLLGYVTERDRFYLILNILGAMLAAWYAWDSELIPFVVLEIVWALTASVRLILVMAKKRGGH